MEQNKLSKSIELRKLDEMKLCFIYLKNKQTNKQLNLKQTMKTVAYL